MAEREVPIGASVQHHLPRILELVLVVIGGQPADDDAIVAAQRLSPEFDVPRHRPAQLLIDGEVAKELVGGTRIQLGPVDQLALQLRMSREVQQAQRGLGGRGVDAACDEIPQDVQQLGVTESLAFEFELNEEAGQIIAGFDARRRAAKSSSPSIMAGTSEMATRYSALSCGAAITE